MKMSTPKTSFVQTVGLLLLTRYPRKGCLVDDFPGLVLLDIDLVGTRAGKSWDRL